MLLLLPTVTVRGETTCPITSVYLELSAVGLCQQFFMCLEILRDVYEHLVMVCA